METNEQLLKRVKTVKRDYDALEKQLRSETDLRKHTEHCLSDIQRKVLEQNTK